MWLIHDRSRMTVGTSSPTALDVGDTSTEERAVRRNASRVSCWQLVEEVLIAWGELAKEMMKWYL